MVILVAPTGGGPPRSALLRGVPAQPGVAHADTPRVCQDVIDPPFLSGITSRFCHRFGHEADQPLSRPLHNDGSLSPCEQNAAMMQARWPFNPIRREKVDGRPPSDDDDHHPATFNHPPLCALAPDPFPRRDGEGSQDVLILDPEAQLAPSPIIFSQAIFTTTRVELRHRTDTSCHTRLSAVSLTTFSLRLFLPQRRP